MDRESISLDERIIFALDVPGAESARDLVKRLEGEIRFFKMGLQLFLAAGFPLVEWIVGRGHRVMLDLKFYDIPRTVELACEQLNNKNITFATVHGHRSILEAAVKGAADYSVLAVTVLTSLGKDELREMDSPIGIQKLVERRAKFARDAGCQGVVCSALEARAVRRVVGNDMFIVTPGIRPSGLMGTGDDQKRIQTPYMAIKDGADFLVMGRPISMSRRPEETVRSVKKEIARALSEKMPKTNR